MREDSIDFKVMSGRGWQGANVYNVQVDVVPFMEKRLEVVDTERYTTRNG